MYPDVTMQYSTPNRYVHKIKDVKIKEGEKTTSEQKVVLRQVA
jgi:hypothetical protein